MLAATRMSKLLLSFGGKTRGEAPLCLAGGVNAQGWRASVPHRRCAFFFSAKQQSPWTLFLLIFVCLSYSAGLSSADVFRRICGSLDPVSGMTHPHAHTVLGRKEKAHSALNATWPSR